MKKCTQQLLLLVALMGFVTNTEAQNRISSAVSIDLGAIQNLPKPPVSVVPAAVIDTLTNHWDIIFPQVDTAVTYSSQNGGYVAGQNGYGDIAKCQKFDSNYGVISGGTINSLLFWFGAKKQGAGTAAFTPTVWTDNAGTPGTVLGTATAFSIASIDTAAASATLIGPITAVEGAYNVVATFSPPLTIPANQTFWAGMTFTYASGDSAGLVTSRDGAAGDAPGLTGNFPAASTHTFEQWSDNSWHSFNDGTNNTWRLDIALAVYPVVDLTTGVSEVNSIIATASNTPNPAVDHTVIKYELKEAANVEISVFDITGKKILSQSNGVQTQGKHQLKLDVSNLTSGMYFYTVSAGDNNMTGKMTVTK